MPAVRKERFQNNVDFVDGMSVRFPTSPLRFENVDMLDAINSSSTSQMVDFHFWVQISSAEYGLVFLNPRNYNASSWPPFIHFLM